MKMSVTKVPYGKPVKLLVDLQGYPDGRLVEFKVYRKGKSEEEITNVNGVTKENKAIAFWNPNFLKCKTSDLQDTPTNEIVEEKYYFIAKIDDKEIKSEYMEFTYPLILEIKDEEEPLDGVKFELTLPDGSVRDGVFSRGFAKFYDIPLGSFKVKIEGYSPSVLYGVMKR